MELRHLRYFVAVAERETVLAAARHLNTSQPSISRQIHDLERELGVALFERVGRRLYLTGAGEDLLKSARSVLNEAEELRERARALGHGEAGVLRVGATPQTIERLFPPLLARFGGVNPGVDVRLTEGDSRALSDGLREGRVHLALTAYQAEWQSSARVLGVAPVLAVSRLPLERAANRVELRALANEPLLVFRRGYGSREYFDAACAVAHMRPNIQFESGAPTTLMALARAGRGIAIVPATVAPAEDGLTAQILIRDGVPLEMPFAVHWNPERFLPPYAKEFIAALQAVSRELFAQAPETWRVRIA